MKHKIIFPKLDEQTYRKIPSIKVYRELTGLGLKEAKDAIESVCYTGGELELVSHFTLEGIIKLFADNGVTVVGSGIDHSPIVTVFNEL